MHAATLHARDTYPDAVSGQGEPGSTRERPSFNGVELAVGSVVEVDVGNVAHGGHCVARVGDVVAFVRHALPGERVVIRITDVRPRFVRADTVQVIAAHPDRRAPLCAVSDACGGCDLQHATESLQRDLKRQVIAEALAHQGGLPESRVAELLVDGVIDLGMHTGWRSRMRYATMAGHAGHSHVAMHRYRSDDLVDVTSCVIADPVGHQAAIRAARDVNAGTQVLMATGLDGPVVETSGSASTVVRHDVRTRGRTVEFHVPVEGFWQVHPKLAPAVIDHLIDVAEPQPGEVWWDLYAGVGPIAAALADRVGPPGRVVAVEGSRAAVEVGAAALRDMPWVQWRRSDVRRWVTRTPTPEPRVDGVVLDPPRTGAGAAVLEAVVSRRPRVVAIVACDPIALARDTGLLARSGYVLSRLRVWDAFPQTHHMEALAVFRPEDQIS
jgi:tRNA/tmRNA/rRNA uracil-C5-methylase (TrmA/RlmC/RlmD family)